MVAAHSGALAGEEGAFQALFDAYGVAQVATLDELADTCELLAGRRAAPGGLAAIHDSGGERAHLLDVAEQLRVPLAAISEATRERLAAALEPGLPATNPLDAWGTGNDADAIFRACIQALLDDPATGALALDLDLTTEPTPGTSYTGLAVAAAASTTKPVAVIANLTAAADPADAATLRAAGVPVLEGTATGLAAFGHLLAHRDFLARTRVAQDPETMEHPGAADDPATAHHPEAVHHPGAAHHPGATHHPGAVDHPGPVDSPAPPAPGSATLPSGGPQPEGAGPARPEGRAEARQERVPHQGTLR